MIGIQQIFHKIRQICELCYQSEDDQIKIPRNYKNIASLSSSEKQKQVPQSTLKQYLSALQNLHQTLYDLKETQIQYQNLQSHLQKQQTEIRKHIGIEQQIKIYTDGIKIQLQECQKQKSQLLENSKSTIKSLKLKNQKLFEQIIQLRKKIENQQKSAQRTFKNSRTKTKIKQKSQSASAERKDSSLNKIIRTQYIQKQKHPFLNVNIRKELKYKNQSSEITDKKHKHHHSTLANEEPHTSQSKKKYRLDLLDKCKKEKLKTSQSKQFDLGVYLSKNQLKKSPYKHPDKGMQKVQSTKRNQKHHKSSFHQKGQKIKKFQTEEKVKKQDSKRRQQKQQKAKSKSKQQQKKIKIKEPVKIKSKQLKKAVHHNRSLFSVCSMDYQTEAQNKFQKMK